MFNIGYKTPADSSGPVSPQDTPAAVAALTPDEARDKVMAHWDYVDQLARRRFPRDANFALEGARYVLDGLEMDEWKRVRTWKGMGDFLPFLATITTRLLTDFYRAKCGYIRQPEWLQEKTDPIWHAAYRLTIVEHWERHEAVQHLLMMEPPHERWFIEEVVGTILHKCQQRAGVPEQTVDFELEDLPADPGVEEPLTIPDKETLEALLVILDGSNGAAIDARVSAIIARLKPHVHLTDEECLMLKLFYLEELSMETVKRRLHLQGDPYKRLKKILQQVRGACAQAGLTFNDHEI